MGSVSRGPVKVVIINTQYVETDAMSFKSVVQSLTGKDSTVAVQEQSRPQSGNRVPEYRKGPVLSISPGLSFKDFDRMLKELPPLDELYTLYSDD